MLPIHNESTREDKRMNENKRIKFYHFMLALTLATTLSGCTTTIDSRHSYDTKIEFSGLKSYAWAPGNEPTFSTPKSAEYYQSTMNKMLAAKGFKLSPNAPDFLIRTHSVATYVEKYKSVYGNVNIPKAMVRINFLNPSSNEVIYESAASAHVDENASQESKNDIIDKAVKSLLSDFPPGTVEANITQ